MSLSTWLRCVSLEAAATLSRRRRATKSNLRRSGLSGVNVAESLERRVFLSASPVFFHPQQTFAAGTDPQSVAVADFNGDGKPDLAVANYGSKSISVMLGNGNGTFGPQHTFATGNGPNGLIAANIDRDNRPDLVVANRADGTVSVLISNGDGTFQTQIVTDVGSGPRSVVAADFNRDGFLDLAVANFGSNSVSILKGVGDGTFFPQQTIGVFAAPDAIAAGDFTGDGVPDLVTSSFTVAAFTVVINPGDGNFQNVNAANVLAPQAGIAVADVNGDGKADVALASYSASNVNVLLGKGDTTFTSTGQTFATGAGSMPDVVAFADVNRDGKLDLVVNTSGNTMGVLLSNGNGTFAAQQTLATGSFPASFAVADVNGDGSPDIIVPNFGDGNVGVLLNDPPPLVTSITRANPQDIDTQSLTVAFNVNFSEPVTGVDVSDFNVETSGVITTSTPLVTPATGPASNFVVTVNVQSGSGSVGLNMQFNGSITNDVGEVLKGPVAYSVENNIIPGVMLDDIERADFNGDGNTDLITSIDNNGDVAVLLSKGNGSFQLLPTFAINAGGLAIPQILDVNGDGKPDLLKRSPSDNSFNIMLGNGDGTFQAAVNSPTGVATGNFGSSVSAVADVNRDGKPDLIVTGPDNVIGVMFGNGTAHFAPDQTFATASSDQLTGVIAADFNGDGRPDLIASYVSLSVPNHSTVLLGNGDGTFKTGQTMPGLEFGQGTVADFNSDGKPDLIYTDDGGAEFIQVSLGNGDGTFAPPMTFGTPSFPYTLTVADVNGDGQPDLLMGSNRPVATLLLGNGDGTFQEQQTFGINQPYDSTHIADINGDGKPELIFNDQSTLTVLAQTSSTTLAGPNDFIEKRTPTFTVFSISAPFDGQGHGSFGSAAGPDGEDLSSLLILSYKNLADNTTSLNPPTAIGTYEVLASLSNNPNFSSTTVDTGHTVVITPASALQPVIKGDLPASALVAGGKIKPIRLTIRLTNTAAATATGRVSVDITLSQFATGVVGDPVIATAAKKVTIHGNKTGAFAVVTIRALPSAPIGTLHVLAKLTDANGATSLLQFANLRSVAPINELAAVKLTAPPRAKHGKPVFVVLAIQQNGNTPLASSVPVELFLSSSRTLDGTAIDLGPASAHASILPGKKGNLRLKATIPSTVAPGNYVVIAKVDPNNTLGDTNPANNVVASLKNVKVM